MSAEDPKTAAPLEAGFLNSMIREGMLQRLAMCVALVRVIQENYEAQPEAIEGLLLGAWMEVNKRLRGQPADAHSVAFLGEYFRHAGDWGAMRRCLIDTGESYQIAAGQFTALCDQRLDEGRKEFAAKLADLKLQASH